MGAERIVRVRSRTTKASLAAGMVVLALMIATSAYAKLVVLSFDFSNDTAGFTASIQQNNNLSGSCTASPNVSWGSDGTLVVTLGPASNCSNYSLVVDKLVVLSSPVQNPSVEMVIQDQSNLLTLGSTAAVFGAIPSPTAKIVVLNDSSDNGWTTLSGQWTQTANSGSSHLQMVIPFGSDSWTSTRVIRITSVGLYSN